jgi:uncharacterized damage-inducible protein DinB
MTGAQERSYDILVHMLALAASLEDEGQINVAKLVRAGAESVLRKSAYQLDQPIQKDRLAAEVETAVATLAALEVDQDLLAALRLGADALAAGRLTMYHETPDVYVCRTCGHVALSEPQWKCPTCDAWPTTYLRFPPVYWLDALDPFRALEALRQTPLSVTALLDGLSEAELAQVPVDGGWSLRNVVSHLRDAQGLLSYRLDLMLDQDNPSLESKAVFEWATAEGERPDTTWEVFEDYRGSRQKMLARLEIVPLADWWRTGQHEEFGRLTIRQQVSYFATHEVTHLPQIEALINQLKPSQ